MFCTRPYRRTIEAATDGKPAICDRDDIKRIVGPELASWTIMLKPTEEPGTLAAEPYVRIRANR